MILSDDDDDDDDDDDRIGDDKIDLGVCNISASLLVSLRSKVIASIGRCGVIKSAGTVVGAARALKAPCLLAEFHHGEIIWNEKERDQGKSRGEKKNQKRIGIDRN